MGRSRKIACAQQRSEGESIDWNLLRLKMLGWFHDHRRDLPWRKTRDPYHVWLSEIMLQQTQVQTVIPYFQKFVERYRNVSALANADEAEVLRLWEGLGYYRRARQLHAAAKKIDADYNGKFPQTFDEILDLPGIGRYTAGAISSIALGLNTPILEANTIRLFARLSGERESVNEKSTLDRLWKFAEQLVEPRIESESTSSSTKAKDVRKSNEEFDPGELNQAAMEIGGQVCFPVQPNCGQCPLADLCVTRQLNLQNEIPLKPKKFEFESMFWFVLVLIDDGAVLMRQCQPGEWWEGLWDFPRFNRTTELAETASGKVQTEEESSVAVWLSDRIRSETKIETEVGNSFFKMKHGVTKYRIQLECHMGTVQSKPKKLPSPFAWKKLTELDSLPLSSTGRKIAEHIQRFEP